MGYKVIKTHEEYEAEKERLLSLIDHECRNGASEDVANEIEWLAKQLEYYETWKGDEYGS